MNHKEIIEGMKVNYHSIIGGPVTKPDCTVTFEPWMMHGQWVCMIDKVLSCVSCDALSPVKPGSIADVLTRERERQKKFEVFAMLIHLKAWCEDEKFVQEQIEAAKIEYPNLSI